MVFRKPQRLVTSLYLGVCLFAVVPAAADGRIAGRVGDQSGAYFLDGAIVSIKALQLRTVSANGGYFVFRNVPAGQHTLHVDYLGAQSVGTEVVVSDGATVEPLVLVGARHGALEEIVVYGQTASAGKALNQMRAADNLVAIVSADFVGQFPDENVSEALQRVSGVFIERDQGEGRFVGVRGLSPGLNVAAINGLPIPSPESDTRAVALDVLPSDMIERLEVAKSLTPDMDADAIGGTINVKSLSAFDRKNLHVKVRGQGRRDDMADETTVKFSGAFTNVFALNAGELGVALSYSNGEKTIAVDNIEVDGGWDNDLEDSGVRAAEEVEQRDYEVTRERDGVALNLDYRANAASRYYLRALHSRFTDTEFRNRIEFKLDEGDIATLADSSHVRTDTELQRELKDRFEEQRILSVVLGGENHRGDWTIAYAYGRSKAEEAEPGRIDSQFKNDGVERAGYARVGQALTLNMSADALDPTRFELDEIVVENNATQDARSTFTLDVTRELRFGDHPGFVKFGVKRGGREKTLDLNARIYDGFAADPTLADFVSGDVDYTLGDYGPYIDYRRQRAFVQGTLRTSACAPATYDEDECDFELDEDATALASARDYLIEEDVTALYAMNRLDVGQWRLIYGLRMENTDFAARGFSAREVDIDSEDDVQIVPNAFSDNYRFLFPSLHVRFEPRQDLIFRFASTRAISRPSFGDLNPSPAEIEIEEDDDEIALSVEAGNPHLRPFEAMNLDLSVEYYPGDIGAFAVGVFHKRIDNFIFDADVSGVVDPALYAGSIAVTDVEVLMPRNGEEAKLLGMELSWTRQLHKLPAPFNGLLLMANLTFTHSDANLGLPSDAGRSSASTLPNQADTVGNVVIGFENERVSLRLSAAYLSERVIEIDLQDETNDLYEDDHLQVDFTAKYDFTDNVQGFLNIVNATEEPNYRYFGSRGYAAQHDVIGRSLVLGATYRN